MAPPTKEQLAQWDREDPLNWTRSEFEIPDAKACGGDVGECNDSVEVSGASRDPCSHDWTVSAMLSRWVGLLAPLLAVGGARRGA